MPFHARAPAPVRFHTFDGVTETIQSVSMTLLKTLPGKDDFVMDANSIVKYVDKEHRDEVAQLVKDNDIAGKVSLKNPVVACILAIFVGIIGIDRLYIGGVKEFLCKIAMICLTLGTWWVVDIGYSAIVAKKYNYEKIIAAAA